MFFQDYWSEVTSLRRDLLMCQFGSTEIPFREVLSEDSGELSLSLLPTPQPLIISSSPSLEPPSGDETKDTSNTLPPSVLSSANEVEAQSHISSISSSSVSNSSKKSSSYLSSNNSSSTSQSSSLQSNTQPVSSFTLSSPSASPTSQSRHPSSSRIGASRMYRNIPVAASSATLIKRNATSPEVQNSSKEKKHMFGFLSQGTNAIGKRAKTFNNRKRSRKRSQVCSTINLSLSKIISSFCQA